MFKALTHSRKPCGNPVPTQLRRRRNQRRCELVDDPLRYPVCPWAPLTAFAFPTAVERPHPTQRPQAGLATPIRPLRPGTPSATIRTKVRYSDLRSSERLRRTLGGRPGGRDRDSTWHRATGCRSVAGWGGNSESRPAASARDSWLRADLSGGPRLHENPPAQARGGPINIADGLRPPAAGGGSSPSGWQPSPRGQRRPCRTMRGAAVRPALVAPACFLLGWPCWAGAGAPD